MKAIRLNGREVPYRVTAKNNKNTYYYFKRDGYIQINLAHNQNERDALNYITANETTFYRKYLKHCVRTVDDSVYRLWGKEYRRMRGDGDLIFTDDTVRIPDDATRVTAFEKAAMTEYLSELVDRYMDNGFIDIKNITLRTRYAKTRHGSCNPRLRTININTHLVHLDKRYTEYVFLHEICHLVHANHGADFYDLLHRLCPDYRVIRRELKALW